jgi:hypothetical protein
VFPVADLDTCAALHAAARHLPNHGLLYDAVMLKPGSTVETLYRVMKRPPYQLLDGDFVRSECRAAGDKKRVLRKDDVLTPATKACLWTSPLFPRILT